MERCKRDLEALNQKDPWLGQPQLWRIVFATAAERFDVHITNLLGLMRKWDTGRSYSTEQIRQVIEAACNSGNVTKNEFWRAVRTRAQEKYDKACQISEDRNRALEHRRLQASLPDDKDLSRFQRYGALLLRQFYQALHELQRMQAKRLGHISSPPMAVDINIDSGPSQ